MSHYEERDILTTLSLSHECCFSFRCQSRVINTRIYFDCIIVVIWTLSISDFWRKQKFFTKLSCLIFVFILWIFSMTCLERHITWSHEPIISDTKVANYHATFIFFFAWRPKKDTVPFFLSIFSDTSQFRRELIDSSNVFLLRSNLWRAHVSLQDTWSCVCACVRACVRARARARVCVCVCVCVPKLQSCS